MSQEQTERSHRYLRHYLNAEQQGRDIAAEWIRHPSTKPIIEQYRPAAQGILDTPPVDRFTIGEKAQAAVTGLTLAALHSTTRNAAGDIVPSIFDPVHGWQMTPEERAEARQIAENWAAFLVIVANNLKAHEVPIDTQYRATAGDRTYSGDLLALGELLALPEIDLDLDARFLVDKVINTAPPMRFGFHDHQTSVRHRRPEKTDRTAAAIQRGLVEDATGETTFPERRTPKKRDPAAAADDSPTRLMHIRRQAILKVYQEEGRSPREFTAPRIRRDWIRQTGTPAGRMIRMAMEEELNRGQHPNSPKKAEKPGERTLRRDLQVLGITASPGKTARQ